MVVVFDSRISFAQDIKGNVGVIDVLFCKSWTYRVVVNAKSFCKIVGRFYIGKLGKSYFFVQLNVVISRIKVRILVKKGLETLYIYSIY